MDSSVSSRQKEIREISSLSLMLSLKWSSMTCNQSSSNLTSSSISPCPGGAWVGGKKPHRRCEGKDGVCKVFTFLQCWVAEDHQNCQHPQSDKTPLTCAPALQSKQIIRRTTSIREAHMQRLKKTTLNQDLSCLHIQNNDNKKRERQNDLIPSMPSSGLEEWKQFINFTACQHGHSKHAVPLVSLEIDSVYYNSFLPCPNLPQGEKYDNIYATPEPRGRQEKSIASTSHILRAAERSLLSSAPTVSGEV